MKANAGAWGWNQPANLGRAWHWEWVGDGGTLRGYTIRPDLFGWPPTTDGSAQLRA